jgi:hypothetical protein
MKKYLLLLIPALAWGLELPPTPFPVFLKAGYSSILEFYTSPSRVVLGDTQSFQVERLDHSIVLKTLTPYASTNMFVYFKDAPTRLFVLTASEDAQPTYYKKFENPAPPKAVPDRASVNRRYVRSSRVKSIRFDAKKDYLTVEAEITSDSAEIIRPNWPLVRLKQGTRVIAPIQLWSERKDVQKDSTVRSRFIFAKPNITRSLDEATLVIPIEGDTRTISLPLKGNRS